MTDREISLLKEYRYMKLSRIENDLIDSYNAFYYANAHKNVYLASKHCYNTIYRECFNDIILEIFQLLDI